MVSGAVVAFLRLREEGGPAALREYLRGDVRAALAGSGGQLLAIALVLLMIFTVVGIPFGIYFFIAWQFIQQEILFKDRSTREALRGSHALVRGHWLRTILIAGFLTLLSLVAGPFLGLFLIFLNFSPITVNLIGSIVFAPLIPYVAAGRTLLYFDLEAREAEAPAARRRRRLPWPRPAETS